MEDSNDDLDQSYTTARSSQSDHTPTALMSGSTSQPASSPHTETKSTAHVLLPASSHNHSGDIHIYNSATQSTNLTPLPFHTSSQTQTQTQNEPQESGDEIQYIEIPGRGWRTLPFKASMAELAMLQAEAYERAADNAGYPLEKWDVCRSIAERRERDGKALGLGCGGKQTLNQRVPKQSRSSEHFEMASQNVGEKSGKEASGSGNVYRKKEGSILMGRKTLSAGKKP